MGQTGRQADKKIIKKLHAERCESQTCWPLYNPVLMIYGLLASTHLLLHAWPNRRYTDTPGTEID